MVETRLIASLRTRQFGLSPPTGQRAFFLNFALGQSQAIQRRPIAAASGRCHCAMPQTKSPRELPPRAGFAPAAPPEWHQTHSRWNTTPAWLGLRPKFAPRRLTQLSLGQALLPSAELLNRLSDEPTTFIIFQTLGCLFQSRFERIGEF